MGYVNVTITFLLVTVTHLCIVHYGGTFNAWKCIHTTKSTFTEMRLQAFKGVCLLLIAKRAWSIKGPLTKSLKVHRWSIIITPCENSRVVPKGAQFERTTCRNRGLKTKKNVGMNFLKVYPVAATQNGLALLVTQ